VKSGLWLGPYAAMVELDGVQAGVATTTERPTSSRVALSGAQFIRQAPRAPRQWELSLAPWGTPDSTIALLHMAAQGCIDGDVWYLDESLARENMLPSEFTAPRSASSWQGSMDSTTGLPAMPNVPAGQVVQVPVRAGVQYRLSGVTTSASGTVLGTTKLGTAAAVDVVAPSGSGSRWWSVVLTPASSVALAVTITASSVRNLRLVQAVSGSTFADAATTWQPGQGMPCRVQVLDPQRTLQLLLESGHGRSDRSVVLREVGVSGVVA